MQKEPVKGQPPKRELPPEARQFFVEMGRIGGTRKAHNRAKQVLTFKIADEKTGAKE